MGTDSVGGRKGQGVGHRGGGGVRWGKGIGEGRVRRCAGSFPVHELFHIIGATVVYLCCNSYGITIRNQFVFPGRKSCSVLILNQNSITDIDLDPRASATS